MDQYNGYGYYGEGDRQFYEKDPYRKPRRGIGGYIATAVLSFIAGCLVMSILFANAGFIREDNGSGFEGLIPEHPPATLSPTVTPDSSVPRLTPVPTERQMPELDGVTPNVSDNVNPIPDIVEQVSSGIVSVINYVNSSKYTANVISGTGTGFVISTEGYIATNAHIIEGATAVSVIMPDGVELEAELVGLDKIYDIAVLKIDRPGLKPLKLGDSKAVRVGEFVIAIGDPTGRELAGTPTFGIVSAIDREVNIEGQSNVYIQVDAAVNPGNSGGPLLNMRGEVIGMVSAKTITASYDEYGNAISAEGLGFALPINGALEVMQNLITSGHMPRPGLGVSVIEVDELNAKMYDIPYGMLVASVIVDGAADKAGIKPGDIVLESEGVAVPEQAAFVKSIQNKKVGESVLFKVWRDGETLELNVVIGDRNTYGSELVDDLTIEDFSYFEKEGEG